MLFCVAILMLIILLHTQLYGSAITSTNSEPTPCQLKMTQWPRRQVVYPFMLRLYHWNYALAPWLVRWLLRLTGRKRSRP
jgi:hypothetical protein